jgi:hypothetical protein
MGHSAATRVSTAGNHALGSHSDVSGTPARGDIYVRSAGGVWVPKTLGAANTFLASDGSDPNWRAILESDITDGALLARLAANETVAGTWDFTPGLKERGRSAALGTWTSVAYNAANFTASGTMTWTVQEADQVSFGYMLFGKTMVVRFTLNLTSVGGAASTELRIAIPGGHVASSTGGSPTIGAIRAYDNGTDTVGFCGVVASAGYVRCWRGGFSNWAASANNTSVQGMATFEVD